MWFADAAGADCESRAAPPVATQKSLSPQPHSSPAMFVFKKAAADSGDAKEAATLQGVAATAAAFFAYLALVRAAPTLIALVRGY
jgi:hypothetical protein